MLLEVKVFGSREWYEQALPMLGELGLRERPDLAWADPETDGEYMGCYFDLEGASVSVDPAQLSDGLTRIRKIVMDGEAPQIDIAFVPSPPPKA